MKSVLVLTDFSAAARCAAERALVIAAQFGVDIWLLNAYPITPYLPPIGITIVPETTSDQKRRSSINKLNREAKRLEHICSSILPGCKLIVRPIALEGQLAERAAALAHRKKSILTVMGISGRPYSDLFFSGEIKAVLQQSRCPVLAIPEHSISQGIRHILFATDLSVDDERLLAELVSFSARMKARLTIGHVSEPVLMPDFTEERRTSAFGDRIKSMYPTINYINSRATNITDALEKVSYEKQADVIALRYGKHSFLYHLLHENPLKELVELGHAALLIFPENTVRHE